MISNNLKRLPLPPGTCRISKEIHMKRMLPLTIGLCLIFSLSTVMAQDHRIEVNGTVGYTFSNGIDISPIDVEGVLVDRISPTSAFNWDVGMDVFLSEGWALGFNFGQQRSMLRARVRSAPDIDVSDMNINNYHGIFTYNFGDEDSEIRPYIFGGLGATQYQPGPVNGASASSRTRFSTTWGGGVKYFLSEHFGIRGGVRWTPTYITSTPGGIWCSPWYCWHVANDLFSHQFEMGGGAVVRF